LAASATAPAKAKTKPPGSVALPGGFLKSVKRL